MAGQVKDREAFQRLSFLYQVSPSRGARAGRPAPPSPRALCGTRPPWRAGGIPTRKQWRQTWVQETFSCNPGTLFHFPTFTPGCKGQRWTVQTCLTCQRSRRFLNDPAHVLWGDLPEAQLGSQSDPKPPQPLPSTARPTPPHLTEEKVQPQSSRHQ
ncbi:PREDICTED: ribonuclease P protein subunit p21 [Myotis davidii]|uniref:ribonuclease P protein subunit p21 n=1 Tax=Myotis davidii TaxID=225400 RepID=UPI000767B97C|nr:PREDICTED: ribonuclease P protein subunit p21 [Myotis davidii]